jgi:polysaccharide deacetylase 2 family uncharacterized protein YibQ
VKRGLAVVAVCAALGVAASWLPRRDLTPERTERQPLQQTVEAVIESGRQAHPVTDQAQETASLNSTAVIEAAAVMAPPQAPKPTRQRWLENAVAVKPPAGRPMIAVVIDDMGMDRRRSARALELPGPLTMAFLPYAQDLGAQTNEARRRGHELMVHVPMEPTDKSVNPGPHALLTSMPRDEIIRRLQSDLAAFDGYVGVNNHMGSRFTADPAAMTPVLQELRSRGLLFLDSRTGPSVGAEIAKSLDLPHAARDVFIDHDVSAQAVADALRKLEAVARRSGYAIGIGHPKDETLGQLQRWLPGLEAKGFALVPVSAVVRATRPHAEIQQAAQGR